MEDITALLENPNREKIIALAVKSDLPAIYKAALPLMINALSDNEFNALVVNARAVYDLLRSGDYAGARDRCLSLGIPVQFADGLMRYVSIQAKTI